MRHTFFAKGNLAAILKKVNEIKEEFNSLEYKDISISDGGNGDIKLIFTYEVEKKNTHTLSSVEDKLNNLVGLARQYQYYKSVEGSCTNDACWEAYSRLHSYLNELIKEFSNK